MPQGKWLEWKPCELSLGKVGKVLDAGDYYIPTSMEEVPLFLKENSLVGLVNPISTTQNYSIEEVHIVGFVTESSVFTLYHDDGSSKKYEKEGFAKTKFFAKSKPDGGFETSVELLSSHPTLIPTKKVIWDLYDGSGQRFSSTQIV